MPETIGWAPGAVIRARHEGVGPSEMWFVIAARCGVDIRCASSAGRLPQDAPRFVAYPVTGGITFTSGGVKIDEPAQVMSTRREAIPGRHACGEMVGGLFHTNHPGGTGLMSGAVFGKIAGANAAGE
jgi:tricarballylate dehydrogenase